LTDVVQFVQVEHCGLRSHQVLLNLRAELLPTFAFFNQNSGCLAKEIWSSGSENEFVTPSRFKYN
jgi:hypothetical protein